MNNIGAEHLRVTSWRYVARQKSQHGPYRLCPDAWKLRVKAYMEARRGRVTECAAAIGCSKGMITQLLRLSTDKQPGPPASRIAGAVAAWSGIALPDDAAADEEFAEMLAEGGILRALDPQLVKDALAMVRGFRRAAERARDAAKKRPR